MNQNKSQLVKDRVESLGREMKDTGRNLWLAGLGVASSAESKGRRLFDDLVSKGEDRRSSLKRPLVDAKNRVKTRGEELGRQVEDRMSTALHRFGVPGREEITTLITRIEQLTQKVEDLAAAQR